MFGDGSHYAKDKLFPAEYFYYLRKKNPSIPLHLGILTLESLR